MILVANVYLATFCVVVFLVIVIRFMTMPGNSRDDDK